MPTPTAPATLPESEAAKSDGRCAATVRPHLGWSREQAESARCIRRAKIGKLCHQHDRIARREAAK